MSDGSSVLVDENYVRESILVPGAKVRQGFQPLMPSFAGQLTDRQIDALIAYIRSLQ
jgi:cytochrome c oxidase subunit 2